METTLQVIRWKDTLEEETVIFGIGEWDGEEDDSNIFFWVRSMNEIEENDFMEFEIV